MNDDQTNPSADPGFHTTEHAVGSAARRYYEQTMAMLQQLYEHENNAVDEAAALCADRIAKGGLVFLFGCGHSRMMCEEMTPRQGCFPGFVALVEQAISNHAAIVGSNGLRGPLHLEKYEGYAEQLLNSFQFGSHDVMIVISTSGIRALPVEMAMGAKQRGLDVIAVVSEPHCANSKPHHTSGQKLIDVADIVLDNHCPPGDCVVEIEGLEWRTGPTSRVTGRCSSRCSVAGSRKNCWQGV